MKNWSALVGLTKQAGVLWIALIGLPLAAQADALSSLDGVQNLIKLQTKKLQEMQKHAHDVLFFNKSTPKNGVGFCGQFWHSLQTQDVFEIPKPTMLAASQQEKEEMFKALQNFAKDNFDRYISQGGKLTPNEYTDAEGRTWRLGPFAKGKTNNPKDLPAKFEIAWQNNADKHGYFDKDDLFDQNLSTHILYLQTYPIAGYVRPLIVTFSRDQCEKCTGISLGIHIVAVDGLIQPDWMKGRYLSQASYARAQTQSTARNTSMPTGPFLLMGIGIFNSRLIFWTLKKQTYVEPSPREMAEGVGFYKSGDANTYFRNYEIDVLSLDEPRYEGVNHLCNINFN
jgi:hypothetical protein